jgi:hypothetical protein
MSHETTVHELARVYPALVWLQGDRMSLRKIAQKVAQPIFIEIDAKLITWKK